MVNQNKRDNPNKFVFPYNERHLLIIPTDKKTTCLLYDRLPYNADIISDFTYRLVPLLTPELRSDKFIEKWSSTHRFKHPMCGACVPATQSIFYAFDTDKLVPYTAVDDDGMEHWWCRDKDTNEVIDATVSQYTDEGLLPPYEKGVYANWYGWKGNPQIRSLHLLNRVLPDAQLYEVDGDDYTPPGILPV